MRLIYCMEARNQRLAVVGATVLTAVTILGGCSSPRSLVQLDMDVQSTDAAALSADLSKARLHIDIKQEIKQELRTVHTVDRPFDELTNVPQASGDNLKVGVFLDADVSGTVTVSVSVVDQSNCAIGTADDITVTVKSGTTSVADKIVINIVSVSTCSGDGGAPLPDGDDTAETNPTGPDAGNTDDAGPGNTDDASASDAGGGDSAAADVYCPPETGPEVAPPPTCDEFCDLATKNCPQFYPNADQCLGLCSAWAPGVRATTTQDLVTGNTIACRLVFLHGTVPSTQSLTCASASPESAICADR